MKKEPKEVFGEKIGIVAEGGGLRGGSQPGHLQALFEAGIYPIYLFGVSVGALNLAPLSQAHEPSDFLQILKKGILPVWEKIDKVGPEYVFPYSIGKSLARLWSGRSLLPHKTLYRLLEDFEPQKSISSPVEFEFAVLRESDKSYQVFSNHDKIFRANPDLLIDAIVSSACPVPIFDAVEIGGEYFDDGGFAAASRAAERGCDTIFILYPWPERYLKPTPPKGFIARHVKVLERLRATHAAFLRILAAEERKIIELYNEIADREEKIADLCKKVASLEEKERELLEEISHLRVGRKEDSILEKVLNTARSFKGKISSFVKALTKESVKECGDMRKKIRKKTRMIVLFSDPPETLSLDDMRPGDIRIVRERAYEATRRELEKWLK